MYTDLLVAVGIQQQGAQGAGQLVIAQGVQGQPVPVANAMFHGGNGAHVCPIFCNRTYKPFHAKEQRSDGRDFMKIMMHYMWTGEPTSTKSMN